MIMIIIAMLFQHGSRCQLKKHDIAHIASNNFSQHGCWLFFAIWPLPAVSNLLMSCRQLRRII
ncbi:hypothetical protein EPYR_03725 [Erwinia pyrifoliae DSM 12163]|nr:hypothetical protein CPI84_01030 [Erwinia pyrifoliae]MCA8875057.1 hypothetical protein [Erwinia pyrifoliae]CAY76105.1 hypothetical protein EPYR_03725 [Erwinia pyrifoliae DSM 12163]